MELYDIYYKGVKLNTNTPSMTEKQADNYISLVICTYGYTPEKIKTDDKRTEKISD